MKIIEPKPFLFKAGPRAVLLLHAYTGHSGDVRSLGRYLESKDYTAYAPIYSGHGGAAEEIVKTSPMDWWQDVLDSYEYLHSLGYKEIAVIGLSMGGLLGLKLAYTEKIKAMISLSTPIYFDNKDRLLKAFKNYAFQYKQLMKKDDDLIKDELKTLMDDASIAIDKFEPLIEEIKEELSSITLPLFVIQSGKDQLINVDSAHYIHDHVSSVEKDLKLYPESGHVITTGPERDELHEDIIEFLESLSWEK